MQPQNPNLPGPEQPQTNPTPQAPAGGAVFQPSAGPEPTPTPPPLNPAPQPSAAPNPTPTPSPSFGSPSVPPLPPSDSPASFASQAIISGSSMQQEQVKKRGLARLKPPKKLATILVVAFVLLGGGAAAYFGYYVPNKPPNVWRTALTRTQLGYDKLSSYATSKKSINNLVADGSFKFSGPAAFDGTFKGASDGKNGELSGSTSALGLKINYDVRAIASSGNTPDIYFKVDGIQGLGSLVGGYADAFGLNSAQITNALNGLNGQWYLIDHSLFDEFAQSSNSSLQLNSSDVSELLNAIGNADKKYLFTSDSSKMAFVVKQYIGKEKQDGRSVYHYKVGINKANLNAYGQTLCGNLIKTKLYKLLQSSSGSGDQDLIGSCQDSLGLKDVDTSRTADVWVDLHTKLVHKIRFTNKGNSSTYTDISQDYQGGSVFPFAISGQDSSGGSKATYAINMKLDMKANTFLANATFDSGGQGSEKGTFSLNIAPSRQPVKVLAPTGSKTIIQLLNDLGFGDLVGSANSGIQSKAQDTKRQTDINAIQSQLEVYWAGNTGSYPTLAQLSNAAWRRANLPGADENAFIDPSATAAKIVGAPQAGAYAYQPSPANCNDTTVQCTSYTLTATLDDGTKYTKQSLN